jgi:hypothetical protein
MALMAATALACTVASASASASEQGSRPSSGEALAQWTRRLEPLFAKTPQLEGTMALTVGEGLTLPGAAEALAREVPRGLVARQHEETVAWLNRIVRPERLETDSASDLLAVRRALLGLDAFLGSAGATKEGQPLQVAVTSKRIHFITRLPPGRLGGVPIARARDAIAYAAELFRTDPDWQTTPWRVEEFLGLGMAHREISFASDWPLTCLIVTDGTAVKYTFLKVHERTNPPALGSAKRDLSPWFPGRARRQEVNER